MFRRIVEKGSLAPSLPCVPCYLAMTSSTGPRLPVNFRKGAGTWPMISGPVTPAGVRDRRAHLEAALQDGKTGGNSLTETSFIWAEPDQLFLIKTHFATCSNASRSRMCAYVQRILGNVPSTGHICKLNKAQNCKTGVQSAPDLRLALLDSPSVEKPKIAPLPSWGCVAEKGGSLFGLDLDSHFNN